MIILALVLFLALPISALIAIDHLRHKAQTQAEVKSEIKKMRELRKEIEDAKKKDE